jgi:DNA-binding NarL/FixJ family response regulator
LIRVIVADDHPIVRKGLVDLLNDEPDFDVIAQAVTGEEAVVLAGRLNPDVVLVDLQMPGRGGAWATSQILAAATRSGQSTRVLIVTMFESDARIVEAIGAGATDYVVKSSHPADITAAVRRVADGQHSPSPAVQAAMASGGVHLTGREIQVLRLAAQGLSNKQISGRLTVEASTVKSHLTSVFAKLGVSSRTHAVTEAIAQELI